MDGKTILLLISVVAVGMFVLPSTLALYSGEHTFVNGSSVDCAKCHNARNDQIAAGLNSTDNGVARPHSTMTCKGCHYADAAAGYTVNITGNETTTIKTNAHAAGVGINCIGCHSYPTNAGLIGYDSIKTKDDPTGNYGVNVSRELMADGAAHKNMNYNTTYERSGGIDDMDLACIACHTEVDVDIVNSDLQVLDLNITIEGGGDGNWMYEGNSTNA